MKVIDSGINLNTKILSGVNKLTDAISCTLGPKGKNVVLHQKGKRPVITKDGATIAAFFDLEDPFENVGAQVLKQAAAATVQDAGDGPQPLYSKILTPSGFVAMSDIKEGDVICGTNNTHQTVLGVFKKGEKQIVKILFKDGREAECCEDHLWSVITSNGKSKILTTKELMSGGKVRYKKDSNYNSFGYYVPVTSVEFTNNEPHPIDSYLFGAILAGGSMRDGQIEINLESKRKHILDKFILPEGFSVSSTFVEKKNYYRCTISGQDSQGRYFGDILKSTGVLDDNSDTKYIPKNYLFSDTVNRKKFLQGLLDVKGYINAKGMFGFSTSSNQLKDDFLLLCRSLGMVVTCKLHVIKDNDSNSHSNKPIYRITQLKDHKYGNQIRQVINVGKFTEMQCIKVSNNDNLYITDDVVTTHNTSTSAILARSIVVNAQKYIMAGASPTDLKRGMEKAVNSLVTKIQSNSAVVTKLEDIESVATISANGDKKIGKLIATAVDKVGKDGAITIEAGKSMETSLDIVEGFQFSSGYVSSQFITDESRSAMRFDNVLVLVTDHNIEVLDELFPILEVVAREKRPFVIVSENIEGQALAALIMNAVRGTMKIGAIKPPKYGEERRNILKDLALALGATFISRESGVKISEVKLHHLGTAKTIESLKNHTTFVGGGGSFDLIEKHIDALKNEIQQTPDMVECERVQERITRLASGIAIIKVGGLTEVDMIERKHRIEDALEAVRSAQLEGILPGGGIALLKLSRKMDKEVDFECEDERYGIQIVQKACEEPIRQLCENCGDKADVVVNSILSSREKDLWYGKNFANNEFCSLKDSGVIDPAKVTRCALQNAVSAASTLLTTAHAIIDIGD